MKLLPVLNSLYPLYLRGELPGEENLSETNLANIDVSVEDNSDWKESVDAGDEVTVHTDTVSVFFCCGYHIFDI